MNLNDVCAGEIFRREREIRDAFNSQRRNNFAWLVDVNICLSSLRYLFTKGRDYSLLVDIFLQG